VVDYLRRKTKRTTVPLNESMKSSGDNPALAAERNINVESLSLATRKLTGAQQEVISLRFVGELPVAQVAKVMGKSEGAVKALQHSAILSLRKILSVA